MSEMYRFEYRSYYTTPSPRLTRAVQRLILANILVFAAQLVLHVPLGGGVDGRITLTSPAEFLVDRFAFLPVSLLKGAVWTPFTYMFIHGGLLHLFVNTLWLYFFGPDVERILSTRQFYRFYVLCGSVGVFATFVSAALGLGGDRPVIGASGAVMGVVVAFAMINPEREFFLIPLPFPINARGLVILVILMNIVFAFSGSNTSVSTHFGGMIVGYAYMKLAPRWRRWHDRLQQGKGKPEEKLDAVGRAVDNIFEFEKEKRRRRGGGNMSD